MDTNNEIIEAVRIEAKSMSKEVLIENDLYSDKKLALFVFLKYRKAYVANNTDDAMVLNSSMSIKKMSEEAIDYFEKLLLSSEESDEQHEELLNCLLHSQASLLAANYLQETLGKDEKEIEKFLMLKTMEIHFEAYKSPGWQENDKAYAHMRNSDFDLALESALKATQQSPDDTSFMDSLAFCYYMKNELSKAKEVIDQCLELEFAQDTFIPEHISNRIRINEALGNSEEVEKDLKLRFEIDPDYEESELMIEILSKRK